MLISQVKFKLISLKILSELFDNGLKNKKIKLIDFLVQEGGAYPPLWTQNEKFLNLYFWFRRGGAHPPLWTQNEKFLNLYFWFRRGGPTPPPEPQHIYLYITQRYDIYKCIWKCVIFGINLVMFYFISSQILYFSFMMLMKN